MIIAIDGPAASGKSTTAKQLAKHLHFLYMDTGAMYRAATYSALKNNIDLNNPQDLVDHIKQLNISQKNIDDRTITYLNDEDVSHAIREREVTLHINSVASVPEIREWMVLQQQFMGKQGNIIVDGRDIGTVVFPDAELKIFMVADIDERAKRRHKEFIKKDESISLTQVKDELKARDLQDEMREHGRLKKAKDAIIMDTSKLSPDDQVTFIVDRLKEKKYL